MADLKIMQVVVQVDGNELCAVSLPPDHMAMLVPMIHALSDGPIRLVRLPGVKMIPLAELDAQP